MQVWYLVDFSCNKDCSAQEFVVRRRHGLHLGFCLCLAGLAIDSGPVHGAGIKTVEGRLRAGAVAVRREDQILWQPLKQGQRLCAGDSGYLRNQDQYSLSSTRLRCF
jgi:hypothetical protein